MYLQSKITYNLIVKLTTSWINELSVCFSGRGRRGEHQGGGRGGRRGDGFQGRGQVRHHQVRWSVQEDGQQCQATKVPPRLQIHTVQTR